MKSPSQKISEIKASLPQQVNLVAISKYQPLSLIQEAYDGGQRVFGESHVQELQMKHDALPKDIEWHFIGHLQTNKVKYIAPYITLIHAIDTPKLLLEVNKQAAKHNRKIGCLLQVHVAQEESKYGFSPEECMTFLRERTWRVLDNVQLEGIMCMASNVNDEKQIAHEFQEAYHVFQEAKSLCFAADDAFCQCSWGMSNDYKIAVANGSTLVRIGSKIFGER